jgi:hypothetical protein
MQQKILLVVTSEQDYCDIKFIQLQHESVAFIKSQPARKKGADE